jgi:hypothetical protein
MCYCDWLGFAAAGTFFLAAIFQKNFRRTNIWLAALSVVAPLAAGALTVFQYASIGGLHAFLAALTFRYQDRAGLGAQPFGDYTLWNWHTYVQIMRWYIEQHAGILLMIWGMTCLLLLSGSRLPIDTWTKRGGRLLLLFGLPVLADHLLLINHTAIHNYATLKATPLLIIVVVLLLGGAVSHMGSRAGNHELRGKSLFVRASVLTAIVCIIGSMSYIEAEKHLDPTFAKLGNSIHHFAKRDQVVFLVKSDSIDFVAPNLIYFSGRNIGLIADDQDARIFLKEHNQRHGIIFHAAKTGDLVNAPVLIEPAP